MEVIDIGLSDLETVSLNLGNDTSRSSVNFGSGIELLMNDKKKSSANISLDLGELDSLENELNELSGVGGGGFSGGGGGGSSSGETKTLSGFASNLFGFGSSSSSNPVEPTTPERSDSNIGQATRESIGTTKTWDGFSKINEVPVNDFIGSGGNSKMNDREKRRKKRMMIKKLEEWHDKGLVKSNNHFNMESSFEEVEDEYETALEDKRKKDSIKLQGWWFMTFINSLEYANTVFNPFDLNLDGWGEQVSEDLDSYDEIFSELHDKYKGGKLAPEISLLLRVGFSAAVLNFSNKALSTATPAFNDVIKQSPELMRMFTNATVSSMSQQSPGFAFANNIMQEQANKPRGPPPPAPIETKSQPPPQRPGSGMLYTETNAPPSNRPDLNASRSTMFREKGVELDNGGGSGFSMRDDRAAPAQVRSQPMPQRPEMKGPQSSDIDNILAGLKPKTVNIHAPPPTPMSVSTGPPSMTVDDDSMISISSLKELQNTNAPKKSSRRRNSSDKNTISLDI